MVDPRCPESTTAKSDRRLGLASPQLLPGGTLRILLFPDTASLLFCTTYFCATYFCVTYFSVVQWMMLLNTCSCADYQSDSERCDLKIRLNSSCLNENLSKCLKSEPSKFLSVKPLFYSQEGFCLWNRVVLTSRGSIQRQRWAVSQWE